MQLVTMILADTFILEYKDNVLRRTPTDRNGRMLTNGDVYETEGWGTVDPSVSYDHVGEFRGMVEKFEHSHNYPEPYCLAEITEMWTSFKNQVEEGNCVNGEKPGAIPF